MLQSGDGSMTLPMPPSRLFSHAVSVAWLAHMRSEIKHEFFAFSETRLLQGGNVIAREAIPYTAPQCTLTGQQTISFGWMASFRST